MLTAILICLAPVAIDGDTLRCGITGTRVRLFGIQAPETGTAGAPEAKAALQSAAGGGVICSPRGSSYNRIVATCSNFSTRDLGRILLEANRATEWCAYSKNHYGTCQ